MTRFFLALFLFISACGYHIVGLEGDKTFFLKEINNKSRDLSITMDMQRNVTDFFSGYGILARDSASADYILTVNLEQLEVTTSGRSATREATTSLLTLAYSFTAEDKNQRILYSGSFARNRTFGSGESATSYREQFDAAFVSLTEDILSEFKYEIDSLR
ncbi:MAG: hypothetical protein LBD73_04950 [Deferribacteraceae bacterium]|jgi:outer membrane lipopolysaccharide assembly protein LptE/RlpB|nr:hypothetical protein [Deferribacteraceae bacterium]